MTHDPTFPHDVGARKIVVLAEAQNWRCAYCGIRCHGSPGAGDEATIDHVTPIIAGGLRQWANEVMACRLCNEGRGAMWARQYFIIVGHKGREKAARYARRRLRRLKLANRLAAASKQQEAAQCTAP